ncbi:heavy metal translocating P-type ATPase, partial [Streptococcus pyogenes]
PCALVASVTPATLSAISKGARIGVLIKGGTALENLASINLIYSDKTGTLTYGNFEVLDFYLPDRLLPTVIAMEQGSHHPIA